MPRHCLGSGRVLGFCCGSEPGASGEAVWPRKVGRLGLSRWPPSCLQILCTMELTEQEGAGSKWQLKKLFGTRS